MSENSVADPGPFVLEPLDQDPLVSDTDLDRDPDPSIIKQK